MVENLNTELYEDGTIIFNIEGEGFERTTDFLESCINKLHTSMRHPVLLEPQLAPKDRAELRVKLIQEELDELRDAIKDGNLVEVADALTDLQVVLDGTFAEFGLLLAKRELYQEVFDSNMSKLDENGQPIINGENGILDEKRPLGKFLKSSRYRKPNLSPIIEKYKIKK